MILIINIGKNLSSLKINKIHSILVTNLVLGVVINLNFSNVAESINFLHFQNNEKKKAQTLNVLNPLHIMIRFKHS